MAGAIARRLSGRHGSVQHRTPLARPHAISGIGTAPDGRRIRPGIPQEQVRKNDRNDAEAIAIAVRQPTMRFVAVKNENQQSRLAWHRVREGWKEERTALINRCRGLLLDSDSRLHAVRRLSSAG